MLLQYYCLNQRTMMGSQYLSTIGFTAPVIVPVFHLLQLQLPLCGYQQLTRWTQMTLNLDSFVANYPHDLLGTQVHIIAIQRQPASRK